MTEQTEIIPMVDLESPLPLPPLPPPPEDEWDPIPEHSDRNGKVYILDFINSCSLCVILSYLFP